jgi:hypothetical protein
VLGKAVMRIIPGVTDFEYSTARVAATGDRAIAAGEIEISLSALIVAGKPIQVILPGTQAISTAPC